VLYEAIHPGASTCSNPSVLNLRVNWKVAIGPYGVIFCWVSPGIHPSMAYNFRRALLLGLNLDG